ncbi:DNA-3-methyladenine glycosylase family protein [Bacteroides hominis]|uniref:DNA-3-methyladenine glycosylase family protein n=1 Tax=Bacteroides hominis TaxID=2763023 RepID=UPI003F5EA0ED
MNIFAISTPMVDRDIFVYDETEVSYLKKRDKRLAEVIEKVGPIEREVIPDLFAALVNSIIGQQISTKAHKTIWDKMVVALGEITPHGIGRLSDEELQRFGITFKKAAYIKSAAQKVLSGELDIESLRTMSDEEVCAKLVELDGIGIWTAEMLMLFSMQRRNILSFGDLALLRGMRMVYHHKMISRQLFDRYKKRFSPYASIASLYFWAVAGGAIEGMKDYAPTNNKYNENRRKTKSRKE